MRYGRVVRGRLVLWDVDHTLLDAGGAGVALLRQAFAEMFGHQFPVTPPLAGRTDLAIELEILTRAGVPDPHAQIPAFQRLVTDLAPEFGELVRSAGRVLPGAAEVLAAVAARADGHAGRPPGGQLIQSVLTGNLRVMARVKLAALSLDQFLDLQVGAYGDDHEVRADLVPLARASTAAAYQADFAGDATVLIGDTPLDIEAARVTGARSVGVASGSFTVADLAAAGADVVLPDLADTPAVLAAIIPG
jgi:phosphoglycolate phosphatase